MNEMIKLSGGGVFVAISDDITGKGEPTAVALAIIFMLQQFSKMGLTAHITKSTIYSKHQHIIDKVLSTPGMPQGWKTTTTGIKLLGYASSHSNDYLAEVFSEKCTKFDKLSKPLLILASPIFNKVYIY